MAGENQLLRWKFKSHEVYFNKCKVEILKKSHSQLKSSK